MWWICLNIGRQRGNYFGTFGVSVYSALNAELLHPLSPLTSLLNYGVMSSDGVLDVRIIYDHRVMNGATVARALTRLEEILNLGDSRRSAGAGRIEARISTIFGIFSLFRRARPRRTGITPRPRVKTSGSVAFRH